MFVTLPALLSTSNARPLAKNRTKNTGWAADFSERLWVTEYRGALAPAVSDATTLKTKNRAGIRLPCRLLLRTHLAGLQGR